MDEQSPIVMLKEWWLPLNTLIINSDEKRPNGIHVIEYSAYLSLEAKLKVAVDALNTIKKNEFDMGNNIVAHGSDYTLMQIAGDALAKIEGDANEEIT